MAMVNEEKQNIGKKITVFTVNRQEDESGTSGTGHVLTGIIFEDLTVVIRWLGDYNSVNTYYTTDKKTGLEKFWHLHIGQHPTNNSILDVLDISIDEVGVMNQLFQSEQIFGDVTVKEDAPLTTDTAGVNNPTHSKQPKKPNEPEEPTPSKKV